MVVYRPIQESEFGAGRWDDEQITDTAGILEIKLSDESGNQLKVTFNSFLTYRKLDEGDAFRILRDITNTSTLGCKLFLVDKSDFLDWFNNQSEHIHGAGSRHYCLTTVNSVIDVISPDPPQISST